MNSLEACVPNVTRARAWRLYTERGRLVDLAQAGGAALLGHKNRGYLQALKNAAGRGLFAPLPSHYEARFKKALSRLFPERVFGIYRLPPKFNGNFELWRPFSGRLEEAALGSEVFSPVIPSALSPFVLAAVKHAADRLPPSEIISPFVLACAANTLWAIIMHPERGTLCFPQIENALRENAVWTRHGIYLFYNGSEDWKNVFLRFLESGFLLPASSDEPVILPGELSPGEEKNLARLLINAP
ncbi:MAG: hypothetical protein LBG79_07670 [Spirochaetaceae bacterium]|jgi:hypothetical protein|nr:hypothetical protein [Spirochaetaceae bacterium]GMO29744.1 MAG: hypothetical protein Pg6A_18190 [Termitinemataceae bacterium]